MSVIFVEGFDLYSSAANISVKGWVGGNNGSQAPATGRFNGQSFRMASGSGPVTFALAAATDTLSFGMAFQVQTVSACSASGSSVLHFTNSGTVEVQIGVTSSGALVIGRGDFTTNLLATSAAGLVTSGNWVYVELELTRNATTGAFTVYCNGASVMTGSSVNTGALSVNTLGLGSPSTLPASNFFYDDIYMTNVATKLGEMRVDTLRPSADTAQKDWTPNSGTTNFSRVNQATVDDDTSYNSSATVGQKDLFTLSALSSTPNVIKAVQTNIYARKDDATTRAIRTNMKNNVTTTNGTTRNLTTSYLMFTDIYETNPDTAAAFTGANVNAMQLGYEVVT